MRGKSGCCKEREEEGADAAEREGRRELIL